MGVETRFASNTKSLYLFSGRGEVYSFVKVFNAPLGFEEYIPYYVALVRLKEGPLVTAQLTDLHFVENEAGERSQPQVEIGMPVEMVTRRLKVSGDKNRGMLVYGYKFRPVLEMFS